MPIRLQLGDLAPTLPSPDSWPGTGMVWVGADGSRWDLLDPATGVVLRGQGGGLEKPRHDRWTSTAPGLHGSQHRGSRVRERDDVTWQVHVVNRGGAAAFDGTQRAWLRSMHRDVEGVWEVTVLGRKRRLRLRHAEDEPDFARDPLSRAGAGYVPYLHRFTASQPFWEGDVVSRVFKAADPHEFFMLDEQTDDGVFTGGLFWIGESATVDTASLTNPGEEEAWPVWRINGPCLTAEVGVDGRVVEVPFELEDGEWLEIDTRKDRQTVLDQDGVDRIADLGEVNFTPIPAGGRVTLDVSVSGTEPGTDFYVSCSITPLYGSAWS